LETAGYIVSAALWLKDTDLGRWQLLIQLGHFEPEGNLQKYHHEINEVLSGIGEPFSLELTDIAVVRPDNRFISALRKWVLSKSVEVEGARLGGSLLGLFYISDGYLYRLRAPARKKPTKRGSTRRGRAAHGPPK